MKTRKRLALPVRLLPTWKELMGACGCLPIHNVESAAGLGASAGLKATVVIMAFFSMVKGFSYTVPLWASGVVPSRV